MHAAVCRCDRRTLASKPPPRARIDPDFPPVPECRPACRAVRVRYVRTSSPLHSFLVGMRLRLDRGEDRRGHRILDRLGVGRGIDDDAALRLFPGDVEKGLATALVDGERLLLETVGLILAAAL